MQRMTGRNPQAVAFGKRLKSAREGADLTYIETSFQVRQYLSKAQRFSYSTLSRWEHGAVPEEDIDPVQLWALANVYGVPLKKLSEAAAAWAEQHLNQGKSASGWIGVSPGETIDLTADGPFSPGFETRALESA